jgi:2-polyprenyl-3-methyl-5-hydroxy-6-metoxy-1,4-benzoquinol methylase
MTGESDNMMNQPDKYKVDIIRQATAEAEHFDKVYAEFDEEHKTQHYRVPDKIINQVLNPRTRALDGHEFAYSLLGSLKGKKLLDYGAGDGWNAICFAKAKAEVWAIDISQKGVDLIKKKAKANGVGDSVIAEVRNCYCTGFPDCQFDVIYGGGVLHHLDDDAAAAEIGRILHPQGVAVFFEPIRETRIMDIIKAMVLFVARRKPSEVTENETPLTSARIGQLRAHFKVVNFRYFEVLSSASHLIESELMKRTLLWSDHLLMKCLPGFKKLGRTVVVELREPVRPQ